jgi:hypothetical protein
LRATVIRSVAGSHDLVRQRRWVPSTPTSTGWKRPIADGRSSICTIGLYEAMPCLRNGHTHEDAALPAVLSPHLPGRHQGVGQRGSGQVGRLPRGCGRTQAGLDPARHRRLRQHDQYAFHTSIIGTDPRASARRSATVRCCWTRTSWSSTDPCGPSSDATPTSRPPGCHGERITVLGTDRVWTPGIPVAERGRHQCASSRAGLERRSGRVGRPG